MMAITPEEKHKIKTKNKLTRDNRTQTPIDP
jgi:hypothetical protein